MIKVTESGAHQFLAQLLAIYLNTGDLTLRLFTNNYTPVYATQLSDLTEAGFDGYGSIMVDDWVDLGDDGDAAVCSGVSEREWTLTSLGSGAATIYGYFIFHISADVLYAERLPSPITLDTIGQSVKITPRFLLGNCP